MSELRELYQSVILDHNRQPRNFGEVKGANRVARGDNPLCGDQVIVQAEVDGDRVVSVGFHGSGCAISKASASLMTEAVKGKPLDEVQNLFEAFHNLVTREQGAPAASLGKLAVFAGVREFPIRVKCATLAWHTLRAALDRSAETVKTE